MNYFFSEFWSMRCHTKPPPETFQPGSIAPDYSPELDVKTLVEDRKDLIHETWNNQACTKPED